MPEIHVRPSEANLAAVHTSDDDWQDVVRAWAMETGAIEDEQQFGDFIRLVEAENEKIVGKYWLLHNGQGVSLVKPAQFVADFEDVAATEVLDEVWAERQRHGVQGYTAEHDDEHGLGHLLEEAVSHLSHFGETPTDEHIRGEIIVAASLLVAAADLMDRGLSKVRQLPGFYTAKDMGRLEMKWTQRVADYMANLNDLAGQAQDELDTATPEEAIGWAEAQFRDTFGVKDAP